MKLMNVRDELKSNTVEQNQAIAKASTKPFAVATFDLKGDLNLGTIIRTAHLTGARDFFILNHRQWDRRSAVGTHHYINVEKHDECKNFEQTKLMLANKGYYPVVVEHGGQDLDKWLKRHNSFFRQILGTPPLKPAFIFGPEDTGFPSDWPQHISLQQLGVSRSFNVSSAAAIVLYNFSRSLK